MCDHSKPHPCEIASASATCSLNAVLKQPKMLQINPKRSKAKPSLHLSSGGCVAFAGFPSLHTVLDNFQHKFLQPVFWKLPISISPTVWTCSQEGNGPSTLFVSEVIGHPNHYLRIWRLIPRVSNLYGQSLGKSVPNNMYEKNQISILKPPRKQKLSYFYALSYSWWKKSCTSWYG